MALYTKAQFAEKCGIKNKGSAYIATYIKRGKLILSGDYIDDTVAENRDFLNKQIERNAKTEQNTKPPKSRAGHLKIAPPARPDIPVPNVSEPDYSGENTGGIDKKIKLQQYEKLKVDTRLQEIKEQKLRGVLIPTDLVRDLFARYTKLVVGEFGNTLDKFITRVSGEHAIPNEKQAKYRVEILDGINEMNESAINDTLKNLRQLIDEFKETRERGERK